MRPVVRHGDPAEEILAHIAEHGIDLVALGSRGQGRLAGLLLGSVSQKVASLAPCAVLIVRPPAAAGEPPATR